MLSSQYCKRKTWYIDSSILFIIYYKNNNNKNQKINHNITVPKYIINGEVIVVVRKNSKEVLKNIPTKKIKNDEK